MNIKGVNRDQGEGLAFSLRELGRCLSPSVSVEWI